MHPSGSINEKLREIRRRLLRRQLLECLLLATGAAICLFVLLVWTTTWDRTFSFYASLGPFAVSFIVLAGIKVMRLPGPLTLAQRTDEHFRLDERLTSALESAASSGAGIITTLQHADAQKYLTHVDPVSMVPVKPGTAAVGFVTVATMAVLITLLVPTGADSTGNAVNQPQEFSQQELSQTADEIRRVADMVSADADGENDYLSAVALALDELASQVDRGEINRMETAESLGQISEHLTLADHSVAENIGQLLELVQEPAVPSDRPTEAAAQAQELEMGEEPAEVAGSDARSPLIELDTGRDSDSQEFGVDQEAQINSDDMQDSPQLLPMEDDSETARHYMEPDPGMVARLEERRQQMLADGAAQDGAVPVGASQQSTPGGGDIGGEGTGETGAAEQTDVDFAFGDDEIQLPSANNTEGQRIKVEASPDTVFTETDGAAEFAFSHWLPSEEAPLDRSVIGLRQQDAVRQYFLPLEPADQQADQKGNIQ